MALSLVAQSCPTLCDPMDCSTPGFPIHHKESACNTGDPDLIPALGRSGGEGIGYPILSSWASLVAQLVKNPPAMRKTHPHVSALQQSSGEAPKTYIL